MRALSRTTQSKQLYYTPYLNRAVLQRIRFFSSSKTIPFFEAIAKTLSSDIKSKSIVTGGGIANLTGHLETIGGIKTTSASSELATTGYAAGGPEDWIKDLETKMAQQSIPPHAIQTIVINQK